MEEQLEVGVESVEQGKELAVLDPMMAALQRLLSVLNGDTVSVQHTSLETQSVDLDLIICKWKPLLEVGVESVEQAKELAVLDPMMAVLKRLLYALSGDIVNVQHTNLETQSVDLDLIPREEPGLVEKGLEGKVKSLRAREKKERMEEKLKK